jgi:hypothetical protein
MMIALVSAKGSPGATVSGLALTLTWPGQCLLAECDPAGGDVLAGYLGGTLDARRGLAELAVAELRDRLAEEFERQLVDLDAPKRQRLVLPGVRDPAQSATVAPVWRAIADRLRVAGDDGYQVIADCGRLASPYFGWALLGTASLVLLVVRGNLPSISHAIPAVRTLRRELSTEDGGLTVPLGLLLVDTGPYPSGDVAQRLGLPVLVSLPHDPASARSLAYGGPVHRRRPLLRAAAAAAGHLPQPKTREVADVA